MQQAANCDSPTAAISFASLSSLGANECSCDKA